jgi:DNA-binding response OmpR family regulator
MHNLKQPDPWLLLPEPANNGVLIVLAEPDVILRVAVADCLTREGWPVVHTGNPVRALQLALKERHATVILISSLSFSADRALELCRRYSAARPNTPILVMVDSLVDRKRVEPYSWHVLQKPFSSDVLRKKVRLLLHQQESVLTAVREAANRRRARISSSPRPIRAASPRRPLPPPVGGPEL